MTSPEWEAANEDDSDRFPQETVRETIERLGLGRKRAHLTVSVNLDPVPGWGNTVEDYRALTQRLLDDAVGHYEPVVVVADEERAALVAEVERLRERLTSERSDVEGLLRVAAEHAAEVVSGELGPRYLDERLRADREEARAEAAEAKVAKVEALWSDADVTWRCSACDWVASDETIGSALWREAERTVSMVCPECTAEGSFVDHEPLVETISALVHSAWMDTKREQGVTSRPSEWGEEQMAPYTNLSERAKDLDRGTVRAVLDALRRAVLADAPAEQKHAAEGDGRG